MTYTPILKLAALISNLAVVDLPTRSLTNLCSKRTAILYALYHLHPEHDDPALFVWHAAYLVSP